MFCINYPDGALTVWANAVGGPTLYYRLWQSQGVVMPAMGYAYNQVLLGDVDGDGRIDYIGIDDNGVMTAWRNGGIGLTDQYWQEIGVIFDGSSMGDPAGFRFVSTSSALKNSLCSNQQCLLTCSTTKVDINGDGKCLLHKLREHEALIINL